LTAFRSGERQVDELVDSRAASRAEKWDGKMVAWSAVLWVALRDRTMVVMRGG